MTQTEQAAQAAQAEHDARQASLHALKQQITAWAKELGFSQMRVAALPLQDWQSRLQAHEDWLAAGCHGDMHYLARTPRLRFEPQAWFPASVRVLSFSMPYLHAASSRVLVQPNTTVAEDAHQAEPTPWRSHEWQRLHAPDQAVVALYARGRDYHKVLRSRLAQLARRIESVSAQPLSQRACVDSAPLAEVAWAEQAGLGWRGKHTLLLNRGGSFMLLGELLTNLPLPVDAPVEPHCGRCQRCLDICPTRAITAPYELDARRCISYLTIEHRGSIPIELRPLIGNRIFGCDDCQLICPWNRFAQPNALPDFTPRHGLDQATLLELWHWSAQDFEQRTRGSALRRIKFNQWQRNLAVALGNQLATNPDTNQREAITRALNLHQEHPDPMVREHVIWALGQGD